MSCFRRSSRECVVLAVLLSVVLSGAVLPSAAAQEAPSPQPADGVWAATVVTTAGDTLSGQVERWTPPTRTPQRLRFRQPGTDSARTYRPADVRRLALDSLARRFVGRAVQVDQVPTDPKKAEAYFNLVSV